MKRPPRRTQSERSERTRASLLEASIRALSTHGYAASTTTLIAQEAGVSRGAMLHQFRTKAELMVFVVKSVYEKELVQYRELLRDVTDRRERLLSYPDVVWKVLSQPSGIAVLEIFQGSRSDAELAERLRPVQTRIERSAGVVMSTDAGAPVSTALMRLIVWSARGLSVMNTLTPDPEGVVASITLLRELIHCGLRDGLIPAAPRDIAPE